MAQSPPPPSHIPPAPPWWRPRRSEAVGLAVGALTGLVAATPLLWLAWEARRLEAPQLTPAGQLTALELLLNWVGGVVVGGLLAVNLTRALLRSPEVWAAGIARHLLLILGGGIGVGVLAPLPVALVLAVVTGRVDSLCLLYLLGGGCVGWQPGVIAFVFLYTFSLLEKHQRRTFKEEAP